MQKTLTWINAVLATHLH